MVVAGAVMLMVVVVMTKRLAIREDDLVHIVVVVTEHGPVCQPEVAHLGVNISIGCCA